MIRKQGNKYQVVSESGKNLGSDYKTKKEALKRLAQVEFWRKDNGKKR